MEIFVLKLIFKFFSPEILINGYFLEKQIYRVFFSSTNTDITITRKVIYTILIGLKHFEDKDCRYEMVKSDLQFF